MSKSPERCLYSNGHPGEDNLYLVETFRRSGSTQFKDALTYLAVAINVAINIDLSGQINVFYSTDIWRSVVKFAQFIPGRLA
jgi:hypothetical protein